MKKVLFLTLALTTLFVACKKTEYVDAPPQLQFTVIGENGNMVNSAKVVLYATYEDWYNIENPLDSALTDSTGKCLFKDLQEVYYFFDVNKGDSLYNSSSNTSTENPLSKGVLTNITIILKKSEI